MKKILTVILSLFVIGRVEATFNQIPPVVLETDSTVNFKQIAGTEVTLISTGDLPTDDFILVDIIFVGSSISGTPTLSTRPSFSIGTNSPDYDNIIDSFTSPLLVTNTTASFSLGSTSLTSYGQAPFIPAGAEVKLKIITPDSTATTNIQQIYLLGFKPIPVGS